MLSLDGIARAVGGEVRGNMVRAPGPDHSLADLSLGIWITADGQDITVDSKAGDDPIFCKDYVRRKIGLPPWEPGKTNGAGLSERRPARARTERMDRPAASGAECVTPVPDDAPTPPARHPALGLPARTETYRDAAGGCWDTSCASIRTNTARNS